jgi:hypothetical protein
MGSPAWLANVVCGQMCFVYHAHFYLFFIHGNGLSKAKYVELSTSLASILQLPQNVIAYGRAIGLESMLDGKDLARRYLHGDVVLVVLLGILLDNYHWFTRIW